MFDHQNAVIEYTHYHLCYRIIDFLVSVVDLEIITMLIMIYFFEIYISR